MHSDLSTDDEPGMVSCTVISDSRDGMGVPRKEDCWASSCQCSCKTTVEPVSSSSRKTAPKGKRQGRRMSSYVSMHVHTQVHTHLHIHRQHTVKKRCVQQGLKSADGSSSDSTADLCSDEGSVQQRPLGSWPPHPSIYQGLTRDTVLHVLALPPSPVCVRLI